MSDEYEQVARGKLKLKTDSSKISKKKKKDKKNREKMERQSEEYNEKIQNIPQAPVRQLTKAELSFKKMQEKMVSDGCIRLYSVQNLCNERIFNEFFICCSKKKESWKKHHKHTNNEWKNSMNIWII